MINWQSILSSFDDKPTLLEWLKKVQKALNESALTTVTVIQEKTGRVNSITLTFNFQDGTKIVAPAFTVNDSVDGIGITNLVNTDLTNSNLVVTYDTIDGLRVFATQNMSYFGGNHASGIEFCLPIMAGNGINIVKKANAEKVEIKVDERGFKSIFGYESVVGTGSINLYRHNICFTSTDEDEILKIRFIVMSPNKLEVTNLFHLKTLLGNTFTYPVNGAYSTGNKTIYEITETGFKAGVQEYALYDKVKTYPAGTWTDDVETI
jgi:hypothetical protein